MIVSNCNLERINAVALPVVTAPLMIGLCRRGHAQRERRRNKKCRRAAHKSGFHLLYPLYLLTASALSAQPVPQVFFARPHAASWQKIVNSWLSQVLQKINHRIQLDKGHSTNGSPIGNIPLTEPSTTSQAASFDAGRFTALLLQYPDRSFQMRVLAGAEGRNSRPARSVASMSAGIDDIGGVVTSASPCSGRWRAGQALEIALNKKRPRSFLQGRPNISFVSRWR